MKTIIPKYFIFVGIKLKENRGFKVHNNWEFLVQIPKVVAQSYFISRKIYFLCHRLQMLHSFSDFVLYT